MVIDKLDKIGREGVAEELKNRLGFSEEQIEKLYQVFNAGAHIATLSELLTGDQAKEGLNDLRQLLELAKDARVTLDITLARGLTYYTGTIFEVVMNDPASSFKGSISGGGRYDHLTDIFGMPGISGVGISFGADRIYDVMNELQLFPEDIYRWSQALICCMDEHAIPAGRQLAEEIRDQGTRCELYPGVDKLKKQLGYANDMQIPYAIIIGTDEIADGIYTLKHLPTGTQWKLAPAEIAEKISLQ
jgi:histidyl-tRNA synthetase